MNDEYPTSDLVNAAVMLLQRHELIHIDRSNPRRSVFIFRRTKALEVDLGKLQKRNLLVDPVDFWNAQKRCKQFIYEEDSL